MKFLEERINGYKVTIAFDENSIHIFNGFYIKDDLKSRGYRFNPEDKSWYKNTGDVDIELKVLRSGFYGSGLKREEDPKVDTDNRIYPDLPHSYTVLELRNKIDGIINRGFPGIIWIRGVISSEIKRYKWFSYFNIKDEDNDNLFFNVECRNSNLENIEFKLEELKISDKLVKDLPVFLGVEVKISSRNQVDVRLNLLDIVPEFTVAKLRSQRDITIDKLKEEGIFDNQKRLKLPLHIKNIGLITSELGTSIKDIMAGLSPFEKKYNFFFLDSRMEGKNTVDSIIRSIDIFEKLGKKIGLDLIIIARGGGSEQSLSVFNNLNLCRRVCNSNIPVISAIGHEKDISAIELCSFYTPVPSTPSGVGKFLSVKFEELRTDLDKKFKNIIRFFENVYFREKSGILSLMKHIPVQVFTVMKDKQKDFGNLIGRYKMLVMFILKEKKSVMDILIKDLIVNRRQLWMESLERIRLKNNDISLTADKLFSKYLLKFYELVKRIDFERINNDYMVKTEMIIRKKNSILSSVFKKINRAEKSVHIYGQLAESFNPVTVLKRGYAMVVDRRDKIISSLSRFLRSDFKKLKFFDGEIEIDKKEKK